MARNRHYSIIVVGGGHAGCEAALAAARLGVDTLLVTLNISAIALMPCNPSIGGPGKGHLVREIGALGGEMASCVDETSVQMKWLNTSKGPAVRSRRAQTDKYQYGKRMINTLFTTKNLVLRQGHVTDIIVENSIIKGIRLDTDIEFTCDKLIITSGTYLNSKIILGKSSWSGGAHNQSAAMGLSFSLAEHGVKIRRLQTATPPRVLDSSVDVSKLRVLPGDVDSGGFMWENRYRRYEDQIPCYLTFTDERSVKAVKKHLVNSPLFLENITDDGPKHCPSIDRKIIKFPDMVTHQIFIEPEGRSSRELYLQGLTTAMPPEAQDDILASVAGLENAVILRYGYAIEYDALYPGQFRKTMESRVINGLYTAGQLNGTSGYEEAAAQGLIAGINAVLALQNKEPYWPSRTKSYMGVLVDDLSIWDKPEPYRITPGHAEFRLTLRDDSAERRLVEDGYKIGLVSKDRYEKITVWKNRIENEIERLRGLGMSPSGENRKIMAKLKTGDLKKRASGIELLQRPQLSYHQVMGLLGISEENVLSKADEIYAVETDVKYEGYASRELERIQQTFFLESIRLPLEENEFSFEVLSKETKDAIFSDRFDDLNQAVRKGCISKTDLAILLTIFNRPNPLDEVENVK